MASYRSSTSSVSSGIFMIAFGGFFLIVGIVIAVGLIAGGNGIMSTLFTLLFPMAGAFVVYMGIREVKKREGANTVTDEGRERSNYPDAHRSLDRNFNDHSIEFFLGIMFMFIGTLTTILVVSSGGGSAAIIPMIFLIIGILLIVSTEHKIIKSKNSNAGYGNHSYCDSNEIDMGSATMSYENNIKDDVNANGKYEQDYSASDREMPYYTAKRSRRNVSSNGVFTYENCPHCGSLNEVGNKVCRNCGKRL